MKVLILSVTTGEGHNSAARAIKSYCTENGIESKFVDTIGAFSQSAASKVSDIYVHSLGTIFKPIYKLGDWISDGLARMGRNVKSPVYAANKIYAKKLLKMIEDGGYDAVICCHLFPAEAITYLKRKGLFKLPSIYVMTDYVCIPFVPETETDRVVIPHKDLVDHFLKKRIPASEIAPIGIPVDERKFTKRVDQETARNKIRKMYNIIPRDPGGKWYLLMSGSMGFGDLGKQIRALLEQVNDNDRVICVCGNNEKMRKSLSEQFRDCNAFTVLGYTNDVPLLMDACDVLFTKPGGITSTEAAVKNIPIIHTTATADLEENNKNFFNGHGMSCSAETVEMQAQIAMRLCHDMTFRQKMLDAQRQNANPHVCREIMQLIEQLIEEKKAAA